MKKTDNSGNMCGCGQANYNHMCTCGGINPNPTSISIPEMNTISIPYLGSGSTGTYNSPNYKQQYKQKTGCNYSEKVVKISLTRDEWNWADTWVQSMEMKGCERLSKDWFEDLHWLVMLPISTEINFCNKNYSYDLDIQFDIPRKLLRMFVYSIGQIAYNFDVKPIVSIIAQKLLEKINNQIKEQLPSEDEWFKFGF